MMTFRGRYPGEPTVAFLRDPLDLLLRMSRVPDEVVMARVGPRRIFLMNGPGMVRALLTSRDEGLRKERALQLARTVLGDGLLTGRGESQRSERRLLRPAFERRRMPGYADDVGRALGAADARWAGGRALELQHEMGRLTLEIALASLWGGGPHDQDALGEAVEEGWVQFLRYRNPFAELAERLPLPGTRRLRLARGTLRTAARSVLAAARGAGGEGGAPAFAGLLAQGCPHAELAVDEMITILLAGHETTATALTWSLVLLARHPEVEAALHREVDEVLAGRVAEWDDAAHLGLTRRVLAEAMRLYPPVWAVSREAETAVEIGGRRFARGSILMVSQYALHRDPRFWEAPLRFDPDRFLDPVAVPAEVYLPFSTGPRGCIGEQLAWMQMTLILATLAARWRFRLGTVDPIGFRPGITLRPDRPIAAVAEARRSAVGAVAVAAGGEPVRRSCPEAARERV